MHLYHYSYNAIIDCMSMITWFRRNNTLNKIASAVVGKVEYNADLNQQLKITGYSITGNVLTLERKVPNRLKLDENVINNLLGKTVSTTVVIINDDASIITINKDGREYKTNDYSDAVLIILGQKNEDLIKDSNTTNNARMTDNKADGKPFTL